MVVEFFFRALFSPPEEFSGHAHASKLCNSHFFFPAMDVQRSRWVRKKASD